MLDIIQKHKIELLQIVSEWRTFNQLPDIQYMILYLTNNYKLIENEHGFNHHIHTLKYQPIKGILNQDCGDKILI